MKLNVNRETKIGLSILLVLLVVLGMVAVRRFMRPNLLHEEIVAEKRAEEPRENRSKREPDPLAKPALLVPVETHRQDSLQPMDDPGHWNTASQESKREKPTSSPASSLIAADPPTISIPPESAKPHKRDGERASTHVSPEPPSEASDDRYSPAVTTSPSAEQRERASAKSMVIQVSNGDSADGAPRRLDRYDPDRRAEPDRPGPRTALVDTIPPGRFDNPAAGTAADPEAARRRDEKARAQEFRAAGESVGPEAARSTFVAPPAPHYNNYDPGPPSPAGNVPPNYAGGPRGDGPPNYSTAPATYAPDNSPRAGGGDRDRFAARNPLRGDGSYEVQPNDSYWTISERVYGSGAYFRALAERNRGKAARPDRLPPGLVISTPAVAQLEKEYPDLCPRPNRRETVRNRSAGGVSMAATAGGGRTYVVQEGDTLSSIARNELGKVSRWAEIYQLNREALGKDYDYLTPGMRLVLPIRDSQSGDRTTRRSDDGAGLLR